VQEDALRRNVFPRLDGSLTTTTTTTAAARSCCLLVTKRKRLRDEASAPATLCGKKT